MFERIITESTTHPSLKVKPILKNASHNVANTNNNNSTQNIVQSSRRIIGIVVSTIRTAIMDACEPGNRRPVRFLVVHPSCFEASAFRSKICRYLGCLAEMESLGSCWILEWFLTQKSGCSARRQLLIADSIQSCLLLVRLADLRQKGPAPKLTPPRKGAPKDCFLPTHPRDAVFNTTSILIISTPA